MESLPQIWHARGMPKRSSKKPSQDFNQIAASILATATTDNVRKASKPAKNPAAVALGRLGGLKGGNARASGTSINFSVERNCPWRLRLGAARIVGDRCAACAEDKSESEARGLGGAKAQKQIRPTCARALCDVPKNAKSGQ
jgi:hypothetical protein